MRKCTWTRPHERPGNPLDLDVASTFNVVGMEWSIQQIARLAGTTSRTLRHYDDIGLVPPSRIGLKGYRYYDGPALIRLQRDRKSTRLNSSHVAISYAVFCL